MSAPTYVTYFMLLSSIGIIAASSDATPCAVRSSTAPDRFDGKIRGAACRAPILLDFIFRAGITSPSGSVTSANSRSRFG
jgi:hypothetical protein